MPVRVLGAVLLASQGWGAVQPWQGSDAAQGASAPEASTVRAKKASTAFGSAAGSSRGSAARAPRSWAATAVRAPAATARSARLQPVERTRFVLG